MIRTTVFDLELSRREGSSNDEGSSLDSIGNNRVLRAAK